MISLPNSTISDIAVLAQTTKENVARVMLGKSGVPIETQRRIIDAIRVLNTENPAGRPGATNNVIGLITSLRIVADRYTGYIARGIAQQAAELGMRLMFHVNPDQETAHYEMMRRNGLANGFIVLMPYNYTVLMAFCAQYQIPLVLIDQWVNHRLPDYPVIAEDNRAGATAIVEHLVGLGHRRIAYISGLLYLQSAAERLAAHRDAIRAAGLPVDSSFEVEGNYAEDRAEALTRALLARPDRPTAIVTANDQSAQGVYTAIRAAGLVVGRDVSVVGFDDLHLSEKMDPPLTTVHLPMHAMGMRAAALITAMMRKEPYETGVIRFPVQLIVRASTGPAPAP